MELSWESTGEIRSAAGTVARVDRSRWRERAEVHIDGRRWEFRGRNRRLTAQGDDGTEMVAEQPSLWRNGWVVRTPAGRYDVSHPKAFSNTLQVARDGAEIGSIRLSVWALRPRLTISDGTPLPDALFLMWLGRIVADRTARSASV